MWLWSNLRPGKTSTPVCRALPNSATVVADLEETAKALARNIEWAGIDQRCPRVDPACVLMPCGQLATQLKHLRGNANAVGVLRRIFSTEKALAQSVCDALEAELRRVLREPAAKLEPRGVEHATELLGALLDLWPNDRELVDNVLKRLLSCLLLATEGARERPSLNIDAGLCSVRSMVSENWLLQRAPAALVMLLGPQLNDATRKPPSCQWLQAADDLIQEMRLCMVNASPQTSAHYSSLDLLQRAVRKTSTEIENLREANAHAGTEQPKLPELVHLVDEEDFEPSGQGQAVSALSESDDELCTPRRRFLNNHGLCFSEPLNARNAPTRSCTREVTAGKDLDVVVADSGGTECALEERLPAPKVGIHQNTDLLQATNVDVVERDCTPPKEVPPPEYTGSRRRSTSGGGLGILAFMAKSHASRIGTQRSIDSSEKDFVQGHSRRGKHKVTKRAAVLVEAHLNQLEQCPSTSDCSASDTELKGDSPPESEDTDISDLEDFIDCAPEHNRFGLIRRPKHHEGHGEGLTADKLKLFCQSHLIPNWKSHCSDILQEFRRSGKRRRADSPSTMSRSRPLQRRRKQATH